MTWNFAEGEKKLTLAPKGSIAVDDLTMAASLVNNHMGIGYLPDVLLQREVKTGEIVELLPSLLAASRPMYLVYPDRQFLPNKSQSFIEFVRGKAKRLP
jgi:DNA-binding transcriptional LysR family regulator